MRVKTTKDIKEYYGFNPNSMVISDDVMSNLNIDTNTGIVYANTNSSYATLPGGAGQQFSPFLPTYNDCAYQLISSGAAWEIIIKFRTNFRLPNAYAAWKCLWCIPHTSSTSRGVYMYSDKKVYLMLPTGTSRISSNVTLADNTIYWVKAQFTTTQYNLFLSTSGIQYTQVASANTTNIYSFLSGYEFVNLMYNPYVAMGAQAAYANTGDFYMDGCQMRDGNGNIVWRADNYREYTVDVIKTFL